MRKNKNRKYWKKKRRKEKKTKNNPKRTKEQRISGKIAILTGIGGNNSF